jgi:hypothetical protein
MYDLFASSLRVSVEMQEERNRVHRFTEAFEKLYGRKPQLEDAEGSFALQVAQDMDMSVEGARYYIRAVTEGKSRQVGPRIIRRL